MNDRKEQITEIVGFISAIIGLVKVISGLFGHDVTIIHKKKDSDDGDGRKKD